MKNTTKVFAVVTAVALSLGSISAFAADTDETVKRGTRPAFSMNLETKAGEFKPMGRGFDKMNSQMSEKPGLTEEEKAQRLEDMKAKLAEKLEAGEITQEQYDEKIAAIESGDFEAMGRGFGKMNGQPSEKPELTEEEKVQMLEDMKAKLAEKLEAGEITQEQYDEKIAAIESGDFKAIGKGFGKMNGQPSEKPELTEDEKAERLDKMKESLSEKLEAGEITQEQYDERIAAIETGDFKPNENAPKQEGKMPAGKKPGSLNTEKPAETE